MADPKMQGWSERMGTGDLICQIVSVKKILIFSDNPQKKTPVALSY